MKDKFSIFSPQASKSDGLESSINFKKSPNKFAVYQSFNNVKQPTKKGYQSFSSANLDNLRKLPSQYSNLRQTLNFKTCDFQGWNQQTEKDKNPKSNNLLRQTFNTKPSLKTRYEKFSQSFDGQQIQSAHQIYPKHQVSGVLGYSRKTGSYLGESKSWHTLYDPKIQQKGFYTDFKQNDKNQGQNWKEESGKWRGDESSKSNKATKHQKILEKLQLLKKISSNQNNQEEQRQQIPMERKFSQNQQYNPVKDQESLFKKKLRENEEKPIQCYTPKLPKYTYQERFKKVGSPTSTENSDSRSPPNKFLDIPDVKKKGVKISIEDFHVGKTLGEGKFGVVMMAQHKKTKSFFALKKIPKAMIKSHFMIEQFALEIRLQSCLTHKNILGIYGFFDDSTHLFIVLQYMEQGTLYSQLKKNRILTEVQAANIIKQITQAVDHLHDHDIAHRDIKPQNIVISNSVYKLCDFGWATLCNERRKTYCGTFDYAAPEILEGKQYDMSVDLWCLGVLTYELLTGKAPFYHYSRKQTMKKILNVETQAIVYPQTMSRQAIDFIQRLVRKDPNERMKTGEALKHSFLQNVQE